MLLQQGLVLLEVLLLLRGHLREDVGRKLARLRRHESAAVLDAAVGAFAFELHLNLEHEVADLTALPDDVGRAGGMGVAGFADDGAVLDMPDVGWAVPPS